MEGSETQGRTLSDNITTFQDKTITISKNNKNTEFGPKLLGLEFRIVI